MSRNSNQKNVPPIFLTDTRTWTKVNHNDYTNSGFDRGHMAPNFGIATRYGREAQLETFKMSNIIPQTPSINRHLWKDLELRVAEKYGRYFTEVWVITGPVFDEEYERLESGIPIPSAYYKIILDERYGNLRALAFLIPQQTRPYARIRDFLVSIDEIEEKDSPRLFPRSPGRRRNSVGRRKGHPPLALDSPFRFLFMASPNRLIPALEMLHPAVQVGVLPSLLPVKTERGRVIFIRKKLQSP